MFDGEANSISRLPYIGDRDEHKLVDAYKILGGLINYLGVEIWEASFQDLAMQRTFSPIFQVAPAYRRWANLRDCRQALTGGREESEADGFSLPAALKAGCQQSSGAASLQQ